MRVANRIKQIEKKLRPGRESRVAAPVFVTQIGRKPTAEEEQKLGPHKTWFTYRQQLQAQEKANSEHLKDNPGCLPGTIEIELDVDKEYQARLSNGN